MSAAPDPSSFDLFQWLPSDVRADFLGAAERRHYGKGQIIYAQGDHGDRMFRLLSGAVRLSVARADGRELLYLLFEPGDCFGVSSLIDGEGLPQTAEASETLELLVLRKPDFDRLRATYPEFNDALLRLVSRHMRLLSGLFADAHLDDITARVASRIVAASSSFGEEAEGGIGLSVGLTQAELALMVGGSRQTVNRVLRQFQQEGLVTVRGGRLIILQLARLRSKTGGGNGLPSRVDSRG